MPAIAHFAKASFSRLPNREGVTIEITEMTPITILFGKNGAGKSILLRAMRQLHPEGTHYIVPERTGTLRYSPDNLQTQQDAVGRHGQSNANSNTAYRDHVVTRIAAYFQARGATREGKLPGRIEDVEELVEMLIPDFTIQLSTGSTPFNLQRQGRTERITTVEALSSGEAQLLTLGIDVVTVAEMWTLANCSIRVLLVDEPDAHIHPDLQVRFADFIVKVAEKYSLQVVIATHSTTMLSAVGQFAKDACGIVYLSAQKERFECRRFTTELKELSAVLGGHALMGPLFGFPLLLVEGDDDYRVWSQVPRHGKTNFSVLPCHGEEIKKYQASLERIFQSLRQPGMAPAGYALLDGDKPQPQHSDRQPQSHVPYIQLTCHETENLYITDEVLALIGTNWEDASRKIVTESHRFGNKQGFLSSAVSWDRKNQDIKHVIEEISRVIDPKAVHWTARLGITLGRSKPSGMLAEFLGEGVVSALWP